MLIDLSLNYNTVGIGLAMTMLIVGSLIDIWKREIHDYYWLGFGIVGFALVFINSDILPHLLSIGIALIIAPFVILIFAIESGHLTILYQNILKIIL